VPDNHPQAAFAKLCLAEAQLHTDRGGDAEQSLRECLRIEPHNLDALQGLVRIFRWEDRVVEARQILEDLYQLAPEHRLGVLNERFLVDFGEFDHDAAKKQLARWLANCPNDAGTRIGLARRHATDGEYAETVRLADAVLANDASNIEARRTLVIGLVKTAQTSRAGEVISAWPPDRIDGRYWETRGIWLQDCESDFAEAAKCFQRVLAESPDDWQTRHRLSTCLRVTGQSDEAAEQAKWADRVRDRLEYSAVAKLIDNSLPRSTDPAHAIRLAELYESVGRNQEARRWYELILTREPSHSEARAALLRLPANANSPAGDLD
jgi:thioredoxin-like negative regulator of GroEL